MKNFWKKVFAGGIFALLVAPSTSMAVSFEDVPEDFPHFHAIEFLKSIDVVEGYKSEDSETVNFKPNNEIVRAEALKMILEVLEINVEDEKFEERFDDVAEGQWFFPYVMKAADMKVVKGYGDGKFKPDQDVTLAEALKMLFVAADIDVSEYEGLVSAFSDVDEEDWFIGYVNYARDKHIVTGMRDGTFQPHRKITRGQLAEVIYRLKKVQELEGRPYDLATHWPAFEHSLENYKIKYAPSWQIQQYAGLTTIWQNEGDGNERFFAQQDFNSTYIAIYQDLNGEELSANEYFTKQIGPVSKDGIIQSGYQSERGEINDIPFLKLTDPGMSAKWYLYLPNNQVLIVYVSMKSNMVSFRERREVEAMLASITYVKRELSEAERKRDILAMVRENILTEGKGKEMVDLLGDAKIIETDTIGVGTGPVDYYYSENYDVTLKYERAADLLLDVQEDKRTDF